MSRQLFRLAQQVVQQIKDHGFQAYIVGGAVRDLILDRAVDDIDIATSAHPDDIMNIFSKVIPTGIEHGTVMVRHQHESFEVTTFRTESNYSDFRRPDKVDFVTNLNEDLARRDFTMNAIAMDQSLQLVDPYQGRQAIEEKIIRTVGDPRDRFLEDPLRMMRAIRFQAQLGFSIDSQALTAITENGSLLAKIAVERVAMEWEKMLKGSFFEQAQKSLLTTKLINHLPLFSKDLKTVDIFRDIDKRFSSFAEFVAYMSLKSAEQSVASWVKEWKLSNRIKKDSKLLEQLIVTYRQESVEWVVYQLPAHLIVPFSNLCCTIENETVTEKAIDQTKANLSIQTRKELAINGTDIISWFPNKEKGAWLQESLLQVEKAVVEGKLSNTKNEIREWLTNDNK
ncbi:CCA tRNA nucleotidyltransferase [Gracilibacillus sp. S3-1-1]|uniref:CCA tRNA nucleotidyltransferase n=1 Tax=Gracilibacillus pellucidus TaxID=3095368 RepID=A0ACC6M5B1_9BACI|nr:CCA tRNA nucleotidyltransferase [Gracilibacillus sp. S3-1-1]MDX8046140.1 CCA tRNA nucleotidyltransferase [Gracilibacillus sp. S3-1-1]